MLISSARVRTASLVVAGVLALGCTTALAPASATDQPVPAPAFTWEEVDEPELINGTPGAAVLGVPYEFAFTRTGDPIPTVMLIEGELPDGLVLELDGTITGTPEVVGSFDFTVIGINSTTINFAAVLKRSITVTQAPTITGDPVEGKVAESYDFAFDLTGDPLPTVTLADGELPDGLTLSSAGQIVGTPTQSGVFPLAVVASNGSSVIHETTITVTDPLAPRGGALTADVRYPEVEVGDAQVVTGTGFEPGESVDIDMRGRLGSVVADGAGAVELEFVVEAGTPAGSQTVTLAGRGSGEVSTTFTAVARGADGVAAVGDPTATATPPEAPPVTAGSSAAAPEVVAGVLASTGAAPGGRIALAAGLVLGGLALAAVSARRRTLSRKTQTSEAIRH